MVSFMARICSYALQQAAIFSFFKLGITLPCLLGTSEVSNGEWIKLTKNLKDSFPTNHKMALNEN
jgi:hypothetical protein